MSRNTEKAVIERIDFKEFPKPLKNGALGMFFGKITHGVSTNYFSDVYYPFHLDQDGLPVFSETAAIAAIRYSMSSEVSVALHYLSGHGWFDPSVEFYTEGLEPWDEVKARGWAEDWNTSAIVDMAFYLEDVCSEIELRGDAFTTEWYYAKISHLYFLDKEVPDVAMTLGIFLAQMWMKADLEASTMRGLAQEKSLEKATKARQNQSVANNAARNAAIAKLWHECLEEHGNEVMRRDSNAAQAIHVLASKRRPKELTHKNSGEMLGVEAIRKRISSLRKLGKIG